MSARRSDPVAGSQKHGILRKVWPVGDAEKRELNINIIIVPEIRWAIGKKFSDTPWSWLKHISRPNAVRPQILVFDYTLETNGYLAWQSLVQCGSELVHSLLQQGKALGIFERPLIFVCHGLGGIILKKALSGYDLDYDLTFQRLLAVLSGIVFLGTPHPTYAHRKHWPDLSLILRSMKLSKASLEQADNEVATIARVSTGFEGAGIKVKVLTVYEEKPTKVWMGGFCSRKTFHITAHLAETSLKDEILVGADKSHKDVCIVKPNSDLFHRFLEMVQTSLATAKPQILPAAGSSLTIGGDVFTWTSNVSNLEYQKEEKMLHRDSKEAEFGSTQTSGFEMIPTISGITQSCPCPQLPCYLLGTESRNQNFVGRGDILRQIYESLKIRGRDQQKPSTQISSPCSFAICGLGGMGKSSIALEYVHLHKDEYDAVFWIQAKGDNSIAENFGQIARRMRILNLSEKSDLVFCRSMVMEWLLNPVMQPSQDCEIETPISPLAKWLLIFDGADDLGVLRDYWPVSGNGDILITSRNPLAKVYSNSNAGIDLKPLSSEESSSLMMTISGYETNTTNQEQSIELAERLGGLPLAITQISSYILNNYLTFKEFLDLYNKEDFKSGILINQEKHSHTLLTIYNLEDLSSGSRCLLDVLSLLDADNIRESLLTQHLPRNPSHDFPSTDLLYIEARRDLIRSSIVKREKEQNQLLIHQLTQDVTRIRMSPEQLQVAFEVTVNILNQNWPRESHLFSHETSLWPQSDLVVAHVLKISEIYQQNPNWEIAIDVLRDLANLLRKGGWHVAEKGNFNVAGRMFDSALKICEQSPEQMPELLADALFCCGSHASDTNQVERHMVFAQKHFKQRMLIEEQQPSLGLGAGMAHSEMGLAYLLQNEYDKAIEYSITARQINEKTAEFLGGLYWPFFAIIHHAQALIGLNREGEAVDMIVETLRWREAKYGGPDDTESFKLGYALQVLGMIRERQGKKTESLELFSRALMNYKATIGLRHHRTGHVMVKLAEGFAQLDQAEKATRLFDQAMCIFGGHPAYKPESARTTFKKAEFMRAIGKVKEAQVLYSQARALHSQVVRSRTKIEDMPSLRDFDAIVAIWAR